MRATFLGALLSLAGCVGTNVMQTAANQAVISVSAAPVCGSIGAQRLAYRDASIETLRAGFDSFIIVGGGGSSEVAGVMYTPTTVNYVGNSAIVSGGDPILMSRHDQDLTVDMFRVGDSGSAEAVDARAVLGPNWEKVVANGFPRTC